MLNRRILRVKAMQGLYAYYNSMDANYNLCIDQIKENYETRLLNDHSIDRKENEKQKRAVLKFFQEAVIKGEYKKLSDASGEAENLGQDFFNRYREITKKDYTYFRKNIVTGAEKIFDHYLLLLQLPAEVADQEGIEENLKKEMKRGDKAQKKNSTSKGLSDNKVIHKIKNDSGLMELSKKNKISWKKHSDIISTFYNNLLKKNKEYLKYKETGSPGFAEDRNFCLYLFKDVFFKNESFNDFMESVDISWFEDSDVLKSMVLKTLKGIQENDEPIEFSTLSKNWPEDKEFFCKVFDTTIKHDKEYDDIIALKSKNWDISRIAVTDRIILKMAIGEMINFPGIPVKVTINEYIELSKNFSTPKSKKFVNGILDVVSSELLGKGIIKKSGRGLIDNH